MALPLLSTLRIDGAALGVDGADRDCGGDAVRAGAGTADGERQSAGGAEGFGRGSGAGRKHERVRAALVIAKWRWRACCWWARGCCCGVF